MPEVYGCRLEPSGKERLITTPTDIDRSAPVVAHHEIDIDAPLEAVWRLDTDVNAWPSWQTDITEARLDGSFEPGASLKRVAEAEG
jgi:uncharacterized membrane protein